MDCSRGESELLVGEGTSQIAAADWRTGKISGNAAVKYNPATPWSSYFEVPMISHVEGNLYQGGCEDGYKLDDDFHLVVSLYPWEQYTLGPDTSRIEVRMYDSKDGILWEDLHRASDAVVEGLKHGKVLVHCQAGLNRSGLVAGIALMKMGHTAQEAIDLLRHSRSPMVLCNDTFVGQLHEYQRELENQQDLIMEGKD
jgi:protein-tyrosine phosphatase